MRVVPFSGGVDYPDGGAVFDIAFGRHDDELSVSNASRFEGCDVAAVGDGTHGDGRGRSVSFPKYPGRVSTTSTVGCSLS